MLRHGDSVSITAELVDARDDGSAMSLLIGALAAKRVPEDELEEIRRMLDQVEERKRKL